MNFHPVHFKSQLQVHVSSTSKLDDKLSSENACNVICPSTEEAGLAMAWIELHVQNSFINDACGN
jgi:hypothetical protein